MAFALLLQSRMKHVFTFKLFMASVLTLLFTGCPPYEDNSLETQNQEAILSADTALISQQLSKTSTGRQVLNDVQALDYQGYVLKVYLTSEVDIQNLNGHNGGGFRINDRNITIYINNKLNIQEQAHVIAHEVIHIKDDLAVDNFLNQYPYVKSNAEDFVSRYSTTSLSSFDNRVVNYVLGTLFCTEMRAYTKNQQLANEGLATSYFTKGSSLPAFIDENYIYRFKTHYGSNANAMGSWCLSQSSMLTIQSQLVW